MEMTIEEGRRGEGEDLSRAIVKLLEEIMAESGDKAFHIDYEEMVKRADHYLEKGIYKVFFAKEGSTFLGVAAVTESFALYAEGAYGIIPEFYVYPPYRSKGIGHKLMEQVKAFARERGWSRLEVTTPPLPQFEKSLRFYEKMGFRFSGGRKLKVSL